MGPSLAALHGTRVVACAMRISDPPVHALSGFSELRSLSLGGCGLRAVPPALSCLTALEDLNLSGTNGRQLGARGDLEPVVALMRLRKLGLACCSLRTVPPSLPGLTTLESLVLADNGRLGQEGGGLDQLAALTRLRQLSLGWCGLLTLPPALSSLSGLEQLDLSNNPQLGEQTCLGALRMLGALRRLALSRAMPRLQAALPSVTFSNRPFILQGAVW